MANEKIWHVTGSQNINCDNVDLAGTAGEWMWQYFNFLSGGAGQATSPWTVVSASNGSTLTGNGSNITGASSFIWRLESQTTFSYSWFLMKNSTMRSGSLLGSPGNVFMMVECLYGSGNDQTYAIFSWDINEYDATPGNITASCGANAAGTEYRYITDEEDQKFVYDYNVSYPTYFHGTMDETGSFVALSARGGYTGYTNYPFTATMLRCETPRTILVDGFPIITRFQYEPDSAEDTGPWAATSFAYDYWRWHRGAGSTNERGWSMYWSDATADNGTTWGRGFNPTLSYAFSGKGSVVTSIGASGDDLDGTYPMMPMFCGTWENVHKSIRGRIPDIFTAPGEANVAGTTVPFSGTPTHCVVGDVFLPFTASLLPGT